jgi:hypothetical protein
LGDDEIKKCNIVITTDGIKYFSGGEFDNFDELLLVGCSHNEGVLCDDLFEEEGEVSVILFISYGFGAILGFVFIDDETRQFEEMVEFGIGSGNEFEEDGVDDECFRLMGVIDDVVKAEGLQ